MTAGGSEQPEAVYIRPPTGAQGYHESLGKDDASLQLRVAVPCEVTIFKGGGAPGDSKIHTFYKVKIVENNNNWAG